MKIHLKYLEGNFTFMQEYIKLHIPQVRVSALEATYLVWLGFEKLKMDDKALTKFIIDEAKLGLVEGPKFGPGGESYQRINIAAPREVVEKGLQQLASAINNS